MIAIEYIGEEVIPSIPLTRPVDWRKEITSEKSGS
ncbi:hypothetical protein NITLEN_40245 [Nitrospira lenta]|uniref:Uncharacterized protein n=1 Tax=Nitrospira lenta TaxID=1436998 RepID=A0A330L7W5_9BACT|nr:hypothetical protein NITLEN_40245 [Nitrospira lenta]